MTVGFSLEVPAAPVQELDVLTELDDLQARIRSAEERAAGLGHAVSSNRQIGLAIGILMCLRRLTGAQAVVARDGESALQRQNARAGRHRDLHGDVVRRPEIVAPGAPVGGRARRACLFLRAGMRQGRRR